MIISEGFYQFSSSRKAFLKHVVAIVCNPSTQRGRGRWIPVKPVWSTQKVPDWPGVNVRACLKKQTHKEAFLTARELWVDDEWQHMFR